MDSFGLSILLIYAGITSFSLGILIYLVIKRIKTRGKEGFEDRDN